MSVLKDDGFNTNVVSTRFVNNGPLFQIQKKKATAHHSSNEAVEQASELIIEDTLKF